MLIGLLNEIRLPAWQAEKGPDYVCPNCRHPLTLKKGARVIHHFAHRPPTTCDWSQGETFEHMRAKQLLAEAFLDAGYETEVEAPVLSDGGDRRADVLLIDERGARAAIEIQHSPIDEENIERRTLAYIQANVPVAWIGLLSKKLKQDMEPIKNGSLIRQFTPRPWQRWVHAYGFKNIWFVDPDTGQLWSGVMQPYVTEVPSSSWYNEYGDEQSAGGYNKYSKKWKELWLTGPFKGDEIVVSSPFGKAWSGGSIRIPEGRRLQLKKPD